MRKSDSQKSRPLGPAGHRQRLRERFLASGLDGFHDYEVLELLLTLSVARKDCKPMAKAAMERFRTLQGVMDASVEELAAIDGLGEKSALPIPLIKAVTQRYLASRLQERVVISDTKTLSDYLYGTMTGLTREVFKVLLLDAKNRLITSETLFEGTLTMSAVYPREVVRLALKHHAVALIVAHNHPSGDPAPSSADRALTQKLLYACRIMDVTLHDHFIIGDQQHYSFADEGIIRELNRKFDHHVT